MGNENYYVKITGKANIPKPLSIGHNFRLTADCSVTSESRSDNNDGSFDLVYRLEPITVEVEKDNGEIIKAKDPRRNSVKIRNVFHRKWELLNIPIDPEDFYNKVTNYIIINADTIVDEVTKESR